MVLSDGDEIHPKSAKHRQNELQYKLRAFVGEENKSNTMIFSPMLKEDTSYPGRVAFCSRYHLRQLRIALFHYDYELAALFRTLYGSQYVGDDVFQSAFW